MTGSMNFNLPSGLNSVEDIVLNYTTPYGDTQVTFGEIDAYYHHKLVSGITFGLRIGMAFMTLFIVNLISRNKKTPIYILNQIVLIFLFLHSILYCCSLNGSYSSISYYFSLYQYVDIKARNITIASNVFYLLLIASVEISMTYQAFIIFKDPFKKIRWIQYLAASISGILGLTTIGFYFAFVSIANKQLYDYNVVVPDWLGNVALILFASSSFVTSSMSNIKLFYTLRKRQYLGLKQFSIFHILFIMGAQTMIIPTILIFVSFASFNNSTSSSYQCLSDIATALITISLPATTMWANSSITEPVPTSVSSNDTYLSRQTSNFSNDTYRSGLSTGKSSNFTMAKSTLSMDLLKEKEKEFSSSAKNYLDSPNTIKYIGVDDESSYSKKDQINIWRDLNNLARDLEPNDLDEDFNDDDYLESKN